MKQSKLILSAAKGKDLFCNFNGMNYGSEVSLGYVYYDGEGNLLTERHLLTKDDFTEVDHVEAETAETEETETEQTAGHDD